MSAMSNILETTVLNTARNITAQAPVKVYVGLFLSDPTETGTAGTEAAYTGYARQEITLSTPAADGNNVSCSNTNQIVFPTPDQAAGTVTHAAIFNASSGGDVLIYKQLDDPIVLTAEISPRFGVGKIVLSLSGGNMDPTFKTSILNYLRGQNILGFSPYLALYDGDPTASGTELSGTNYARLELTFDTPTEQVSGQMQISNTNSAESSPAVSNWGSWAYGVIMTALTGGSRFYYKANLASYVMNNGAQAYIQPASVKVSIN